VGELWVGEESAGVFVLVEGDEEGGGEQGCGDIEGGGGQFAKEEIAEGTGEGDLGEVDQGDDLASEVAHGVVEDGVANDGGDDAEGEDEEDFAWRVGSCEGVDEEKRDEQAE